MMRSRSVVAKLRSGLRGYAKKSPDFYKPAASSTGAAAKPTPANQAAKEAAVDAAQGPPSAAAAPKPAAPVTPPAAGAARPPAAPSTPTLQPAAGPVSAPARAAPTAATRAAPKPAEPAPAAAATAPPAAGTAPPKPVVAPAARPAPTPVAAAGGSGAGQQGAGAASAGGGGSGGNNGWLLHPSLPVDVRLLGAGVAGAGALLYALTTGGGSTGPKPTAPKPGVVEEPDFTMAPDQPSAAAPDEPAAPSDPPTEGEAASAAPAAEPQPQAAADDGGASQAVPEASAEAARGAEQAGKQEEAEEREEGGEELQYVDGSAVLGVIEEVFSKEAAEQVRQLEAQAAAEIAAAEAAKQRQAQQQQEVEERESRAEGAAVAERQAQHTAAPAGEAAAEAAAAPQRAAEEASGMAALRSAVADWAGEAAARDLVQAEKEEVQPGTHAAAAHAAAAAAGQQPVHRPAPGAVAAALEAAQQLLGIRVDVSAAGLIEAAMKHGMGPEPDFSDYPQRLRQAEADAAVLAELLEAAAASVQRQLAAARSEAEAGRAQAAVAAQQLAQQAESFRTVLQEALARAEDQQRQQLRRQAEHLATAHAEMTVRERAERLAKLDAVREQLNALERAFQRRSSERRSSHSAHQLATGVFALRSALAAGQPLGQPLAFLGSLAAADPVVAAAVAAVPSEAAKEAVPTRAQLADRFLDVQRLSRELSMVPSGQGGMLSVAVAKLAAKLKIAERGPLALSLPGAGIDRHLAAAQQRLLDGELLAAAAELESAVAGTAAAAVVSDWAHWVRLRAAAEQSAALLEAHAAAETASLA
ncbi:hypothetical protein D9Q98_009566 [Chlorella vulgaris]|uniref:Mitofilin n=1 Tax=Chlorella vulgaris TaxID=3077 RepID=A0A9D4YSS4_CHLVU|nr:hypothetical protein D9Q98_009566 [Chlorella vulgaris]